MYEGKEMKITLIVATIAFTASLLIVGCGGRENPSSKFELGCDMPTDPAQKTITLTIKNVSTTRDPITVMKWTQDGDTLIVQLTEPTSLRPIMQTTLQPAEWVNGTGRFSQDGVNWVDRDYEIRYGYYTPVLDPGQTIYFRFQRK
jgi:ABC-type uncharacterized transport system auxiliary subunit